MPRRACCLLRTSCHGWRRWLKLPIQLHPAVVYLPLKARETYGFSPHPSPARRPLPCFQVPFLTHYRSNKT